LVNRFGQQILQSVEVSTVDGYQGQEKEIIIFSCVRTGEKCKKKEGELDNYLIFYISSFIFYISRYISLYLIYLIYLILASGGIGFLNDSRRLNVAITRAKCSLFLLGKSSTLVQNQLWRSLIEDAKNRKMFVPFDSTFWQEKKKLSIRNNLIN